MTKSSMFFLNCSPLEAFLALKLSVRPSHWFEFDMPAIELSLAFNYEQQVLYLN